MVMVNDIKVDKDLFDAMVNAVNKVDFGRIFHTTDEIVLSGITLGEFMGVRSFNKKIAKFYDSYGYDESNPVPFYQQFTAEIISIKDHDETSDNFVRRVIEMSSRY